VSKIIDPDIRSTVEKLDQRIAKLRRIKEMLLEEYSVDSEGKLPQIRKPPEEGSAPKTSKRVIADFILTNGPAQRKDIIAGTGIPIGTIAFALNDKKIFRSVNGKWDVVESMKTTK